MTIRHSKVWYDEGESDKHSRSRQPNHQPNCGGSHCRVALAAEQDGICGEGEQLRLNPFGKGVCDCRDAHERWHLNQVKG
jgi:hypothetical protein